MKLLGVTRDEVLAAWPVLAAEPEECFADGAEWRLVETEADVTDVDGPLPDGAESAVDVADVLADGSVLFASGDSGPWIVPAEVAARVPAVMEAVRLTEEWVAGMKAGLAAE